MKKIDADLVIFDFDGTLVDSKRDIAFAVNEMLSRMSLTQMTAETIYGYVGNGVRPLIESTLETSGRKDEIGTAIKHFQEIYIAHLLDTTVLFDGVSEMLNSLHGRRKMAVASNKPYRYVKKIIDGLEISHFFYSVKGGDSVEVKKPAPEMLNIIMDETSSEKGSTVFIGDSGVDIKTGKNADIKTIGVTYGYRSRDEIIESKPDLVVESVEQLKEVIL